MTAPDLVLELLGRDSNILLVDRVSNRIMDCLHQIPRKETASRVVLPGAQYFSPPKRTAMAPTPGYDPNATSIMPGIRTETTGKRRLVLDAGPEDQTFPTMNEAVEAFFRPRLESLLLEAARRQAASPLKARIRSLGRRIEKIEADCRRLKEFESLAQDGELLKASLQSVRKGMSEVEVTDWETGMPRIVKLDPSLGPVANMDRLFKRAAKAKRGKRFVERRLNETIDEKAALEEMLHFVEQATDLEELELAAAWATGADVREAHEKDLKGAYTRERESALFREFQAPSGRPVLVGRSGRGNDFLLRQRAGKGDLWFHAKGLPGAHVLLPQRGKEPVATVDIECAAGLALYFSRARGAGKGEVIIARVEDLERPKGALPGQVMVKRHRTMMCRELKPGDHARKA
jgi:predicted ribosome quality control (RQC) complex YloA/Tae2 family protein